VFFNFLLFKMCDLRLLFLFNLLIDVYPLRLMSESSYQFYLFIMHLIYINGMELHQDVHVCSFCSDSSCGFEAKQVHVFKKAFLQALVMNSASSDWQITGCDAFLQDD